MKQLSTNNRLAKNTAYLYLMMAFSLLVTLYTTRVVLRVLGQEDYGIYNVVCGFVSLFHVFNTCLNTGTNRYYNYALGKEDIGYFKRVYNASLLIQIIIAIVVILVVESVGVWFVNYKMEIPSGRLIVANWIFQYAVVSFIFLILSTPYSAAILAHERMGYYSIVSGIDVALKLGFVIVLQYVPFDKLLFYGILMTIVSAINFTLYFVYSRKHFEGIRISFPIDKQIFKELFSFSGWSLLDPVTMTAKGQGCNMVLNVCFGPIVNAAYGIANQISNAIDAFTQNISVAFRPQIIQSYANGDYDRTKRLMISMSKINYMLHAMLAVPIILELKFILNLWLGNDYPSYVVPFSILVIIVATLNCLHAPISLVMVATGKIKVIKTGSFLIICSVIPLGALGFKLGFPPSSIFCILLVLTIVNIVFSVIVLTKTFNRLSIIEYFKRVIFPCLVYSVLIVLVPFSIHYILNSSFLRLLTIVGLTVLTSISCGYFVLDKSEKLFFQQILVHTKNKLLRSNNKS